MAYTTINKSSDHFITHLYSGNDSTNNQTSLGMTPDLVWVKCRNNATPSHYWVDKVRGDKKYISSNATTAEQTDSNTFDLVSGGFNLAGGNGWTNLTGRTYASWNWKANGAGSSNTDGTITSTVSANTTAGFSIGTFTSAISSSSYETVGHSLNKTPKVIITKNLNTAGQRWGVQAPGILSNNHILELNSTSAALDMSSNGSLTTVNSNVFSINYSDGVGNAGNYIFYAFAEVKGFSKFDSYTGNGNADGTFVYTGFKPAFIIIKKNASDSWFMYDNKRGDINPNAKGLTAESTAVEETSGKEIDFLSNGVKIRNSNNSINTSGSTYIYMAFAEAPLVGSNNIPATAR